MPETSHIAKLFATASFRYVREALTFHRVQTPLMAKTTPPRWFLKQWRKFRGYTQERMAEMIGMAPGYYSDIESGKRRYNQDHLEAFADALRCDVPDLFVRDPTGPEAIWSIWEQLDAPARLQVVEIAKTFKKVS